MKPAISIPDDLYREVEACSRRLKVSRSRFDTVPHGLMDAMDGGVRWLLDLG
jgi:hypothetical protein